MTARRCIAILYPAGRPPADLASLARALESEGADVRLIECVAPYEAAIESIEGADSVVFWR